MFRDRGGTATCSPGWPAILRSFVSHEDGLDGAAPEHRFSPNSPERIQMPAAHAAGANRKGLAMVAILDTGGRRTHNFPEKKNGKKKRIVSAAMLQFQSLPRRRHGID